MTRGRIDRPVTHARCAYNWRKVPDNYQIPKEVRDWFSGSKTEPALETQR